MKRVINGKLIKNSGFQTARGVEIDLMHNDVILWSRRLKSFEKWLLLNVLKILFGLK